MACVSQAPSASIFQTLHIKFFVVIPFSLYVLIRMKKIQFITNKHRSGIDYTDFVLITTF